MAVFTARQLKALNWYLTENPDLKLQLSSPPKVYFKDKRNKIFSHHISEIASAYDAVNEEDKRERARTRRQNKV